MARYPNGCPVCGAAPYESCRTLTTGRITDAHMPRVYPDSYSWDAASAAWTCLEARWPQTTQTKDL